MSNMETQLNILANFFFNLLLAERSQFIADCIDEDIKGIYGKKRSSSSNGETEFTLMNNGEFTIPNKFTDTQKKIFLRLSNNSNFKIYAESIGGDQQIWLFTFFVPYSYNIIDSKLLALDIKVKISVYNTKNINVTASTQENISENEISKIVTLYSLQF